MIPAMADGVAPCKCQGVIARNVRGIALQNVRMERLAGKGMDFQDCGQDEQ